MVNLQHFIRVGQRLGEREGPIIHELVANCPVTGVCVSSLFGLNFALGFTTLNAREPLKPTISEAWSATPAAGVDVVWTTYPDRSKSALQVLFRDSGQPWG
jgi:hypothetical protein